MQVSFTQKYSLNNDLALCLCKKRFMQENVDKGDTHKERIVYWNTNTAMVTKGFDFVPTKAKVNHDTHILLFAKIYKRIRYCNINFHNMISISAIITMTLRFSIIWLLNIDVARLAIMIFTSLWNMIGNGMAVLLICIWNIWQGSNI